MIGNFGLLIDDFKMARSELNLIQFTIYNLQLNGFGGQKIINNIRGRVQWVIQKVRDFLNNFFVMLP